jgi:hypothetical protein
MIFFIESSPIRRVIYITSKENIVTRCGSIYIVQFKVKVCAERLYPLSQKRRIDLT